MNAAKEADRQQRAAETVRRASLSDDEREAEDEAKMLEEAAYQAARQLKRESIALDDAIPFNKPWTCPSCEQEFPCIRGYTTRVDRGTHVERLCLTCAPARLDLLPQIDISQLPPPIDTPAPTSY